MQRLQTLYSNIVLTFTIWRRCARPALGEELLQEFSDIQRRLRLGFLCQLKKIQTENKTTSAEHVWKYLRCLLRTTFLSSLIEILKFYTIFTSSTTTFQMFNRLTANPVRLHKQFLICFSLFVLTKNVMFTWQHIFFHASSYHSYFSALTSSKVRTCVFVLLMCVLRGCFLSDALELKNAVCGLHIILHNSL